MDDLFNKRVNYEMAYFDLSKNAFASVEITKEKYNEIADLMLQLRGYSDLTILYTSLKTSIKELKQYLFNLPFHGDYEDYSNANRLLLNVTSSFYSLIEFCEKNIDTFKDDLKGQLYDGYFTYRLFYTLRTYLTHKSLAVTTFTSTITENSMKTKAIINLDMLINYKKINKTFKAELELLGLESISLNEYIDDFDKMSDNFAYLVYSDQKNRILDLFSRIKTFIPGSNIKLVECFIREKGREPLSLTKSLTNICENFSKGIIIANKINGDKPESKDCYYLFRKFAEYYFNDPTALFLFK